MSHVRGTLIKMFQGSIVRRIHMTATAAQCDVKSEKGAIFEEVTRLPQSLKSTFFEIFSNGALSL